MADNTTLPGTGETIRDIDRSSVKTQVVALDLTPTGAETLTSGFIPVGQHGVWNIGTVSGPIELPTGAATDTKQDTGNTSLGSIDSKLPAQGQALAASSVPVVLTALQVAALTPPAAITGYALDSTMLAISAKVPSLGQALAASSAPVVLTAIQLAALTPPANTGYALDATITTLSAKVPALGQALAAASVPVVLTALQVAALTPPAAITGYALDSTIATLIGKFVDGHGTAAAALRVELPTDGTGVVGLNASENRIGSVGGNKVRPSASKTRPANTTTYTAGQVLSESTSAGTVWTFTNVARVNGGTGTIVSAELADSLSQTVHLQGNLYLFDTAPTTTLNDGLAWAPTYAEMQHCVGVFQLTNWYGSTTTSAASLLAAYNEARDFKCAGGSTTLYGVFVPLNAYVPGNAETLTITLGVEQD